MTYIVMALQETGEEIRLDDKGFASRTDANRWLNHRLKEDWWPEYRRFWVEELKDKDYWYRRMAEEDSCEYEELNPYHEE